MNIINYIRKNGVRRVFCVLYQHKLDKLIIKILSIIFGRVPLKDIIVIESHNDFDCNGGALYDYLVEHQYNYKYKIIWLLKHDIPKNLPENVYAFKMFRPSIRKDYYIVSCKYMTADCYVTNKVRMEQKSIFLDHGAVSLKNVKGMMFIPDSVDYICVSSEFFAPVKAASWSLPYPNNRFVFLGCPSHDYLYSNKEGDLRKITKKQYNKIITWMPTFRKKADDNRNDSLSSNYMGIPLIDNQRDYEELNNVLQKNNVFLIIKLHPMQDISTLEIDDKSNIKVLTGMQAKEKQIDTYRLLKDSDALLSDYSAVAYSFLHLNRPIGYVFSDLEDYKLGLCVEDLDSYLGGPKINIFLDLVNFIEDVVNDNDIYFAKRQLLCKKLFHYCDGNSCKRIVEFLDI